MGYAPGIFRSYDIRGIVPDELDETVAEKIGGAFVVHTGARTVLVGRDMRTTGPALQDALVRGLTAQGADVIDVGMVTTPLFYYSVWRFRADAGVMVTASHNPGKYNGFKMTRAEAVPISKDSGLLQIRDLVERGGFPSGSRVGALSTADDAAGYVAYAARDAEHVGKLKAVIDAGNGMTGLLLPRVLARMPQLAVTRMYFEPDGAFPNHEANPLKEENMRDLRARVRAEHADIGVAFDGDGDRVGFTDERGVTVPGDLVTALIAREILKEKPAAKILYDLRSSWATKEAIAAAGGVPIMCRVGHSYIKDRMRQEGAVFAGELSSHFYFQEYYAESAIRAMLTLLRLLTESGAQFSELVAPLQKYAKSPEINFVIADKDAVLTELARRHAPGRQFTLDGLSVEYPDWWFNVRASGTEPLLRLNMEARTPELLEQHQRELFSVLGEPSAH